jgi:hypothetical protein
MEGGLDFRPLIDEREVQSDEEELLEVIGVFGGFGKSGYDMHEGLACIPTSEEGKRTIDRNHC